MNKSFAFPNLVDSATGETVVVRGDMPHGGDSNLMASAKLQVPSLGFQGQMWDMVRSNDDLAPLRKKLSMHEFRLLFEAMEPVFIEKQQRLDRVNNKVREFIKDGFSGDYYHKKLLTELLSAMESQ